jgi:succinate dehydrogenase flavin-adding protein (antitoxin of CptAB toxin-antitoxin module)
MHNGIKYYPERLKSRTLWKTRRRLVEILKLILNNFGSTRWIELNVSEQGSYVLL